MSEELFLGLSNGGLAVERGESRANWKIGLVLGIAEEGVGKELVGSTVRVSFAVVGSQENLKYVLAEE